MVFWFGKFRIDVDVEKTREYYRDTARTLTEGCDCPECRNFKKAFAGMDPCVKDFFADLGVDILKAADMSAMHGSPEKQVLYYLGFCHLCGTVLEGQSAWVPNPGNNSVSWYDSQAYAVTDICRVSFSTQCALVEKTFPRPVIQMDVAIDAPWVLEGEKSYLL